MLVAADAATIAALVDGLAAGRPVAPDLEAPAVLAMLADLARTVGATFAPAAWLVVEDGTVVGLLSLVAVPVGGVIAIGYGVAPAHRGRGIARRAVADLLRLAAADARVSAVAAATATGNSASQRVLAATGFRATGARVDPDDGDVIDWRIDLPRQSPAPR